MKLLKMAIGGVLVAGACVCVATTLAQLVLVSILVSGGKITEDHVLRSGAALYGIDLAYLPPPNAGGGADSAAEQSTQESALQKRVKANQLLVDRGDALVSGKRRVTSVVSSLRLDTNRFEDRKRAFDLYLKQQEVAARDEAIVQVQSTLSELPAKQSKRLIQRMMDDRGLDPNDDVMADIVTMIKAMPLNSSSKIFAEFKTDAEQQQLHEIMVAIGKLEDN